MSFISIRLQRDVERRLIRLGLDLRDMDVLVMNGGVVLTGKFIHRESGEPMTELDIQRVKNTLYRMAGINHVNCKVVENPIFV